ncbi:hypothetical protein MLD38_022416 [Melastoma candidum]|uniref:Uncharacterized protein n=1 Tax=Melastoma candidum TaxID=119954 RepID=A0ACB9QIH8_9MYRT|nr:hypothetical protein MLD38_022416 [Melastoma candidum]
MATPNPTNGDENRPLLASAKGVLVGEEASGENEDLKTRLWIETRKLWHIVGPSIFSRVAAYSMNIVTQAFAGHLGEVELAAVSIANTVIVGFNFGLLLGMASALETLCGQAFGAKRYHMLGIYMQRSWILSAASGVMLCLENWYYRILILMTGYLQDATLAVDALSVCMNINGWEMMIPLAFFAATGVRVANELGAGNGKAARFATIVSVVQSSLIGLFFFALILILHDKYGYIFTSSEAVLKEVDQLSLLLGITILLNSVQPILSGVAVGSGWQAYVAYINLGCYYIVGLPLGFLMGWVFNLGVEGIWGGMIFGGTAVQTIILAVIVARCDWVKEAENARVRVAKWSTPRLDDGEHADEKR